jgi:mRNA-degrading endonuclease RelE of RelBE toxin-antitoxin system
MKLEIMEKALQDISDLESPVRDWIMNSLQELESRPIAHPNSGLIRVKGQQVFKYVMKQGSKGGKDYRAIYDIEGEKIEVKAIFHRDKGYDKEELSDRVR